MIDSISSNAFGSGLAGLQQAQLQMDHAATTLADPNAASSVVALSEAVVAMKEASIAFKASIQAIKAESDALGTLINTMA